MDEAAIAQTITKDVEIWMYMLVPAASLIVAGIIYSFMKNYIESMSSALIFRLATRLEFDDQLMISGRPCQFIRMSKFAAVFKMHDRNSTMIVQSTELKALTIEIPSQEPVLPIPAERVKRQPDE